MTHSNHAITHSLKNETWFAGSVIAAEKKRNKRRQMANPCFFSRDLLILFSYSCINKLYKIMEGTKSISVEQPRKGNPVFQLKQIFSNHDLFHFSFRLTLLFHLTASRDTSR